MRPLEEDDRPHLKKLTRSEWRTTDNENKQREAQKQGVVWDNSRTYDKSIERQNATRSQDLEVAKRM